MCQNIIQVVEWLWLDIIYELCGGESGLFLAAYATIADETTEETRTIRILIISALWHIGTGLANFVTGYILQVGIRKCFSLSY